MDLKYGKLRKIMSLVLNSEKLSIKVDELLSGKLASMPISEAVKLIIESGTDIEIIRIITDGKDPEEMDYTEAVGILKSFFSNINPKGTSVHGSPQNSELKPDQRKNTRSRG